MFSIPFIFIKVTDKSGPNPERSIIFSRILNLFGKSNFLKIILFIITNLFYNIFIWSIIDKFSPSHYAISNIFESFGTLIRLWITEPESVDMPVLRMAIYLILIFGACIHTEMIVINFCNLQKNTKLFLDYKEKDDINLITGNINENQDNYRQSSSISYNNFDQSLDDIRESYKDNNEMKELN